MSPEEREAFLNSPATLAVPPGVQRNFENPDNDLSTALPLFIVIFILSNLVFAGKMYSQLFIVKRMFTEDYLLVVAWVSVYSAKKQWIEKLTLPDRICLCLGSSRNPTDAFSSRSTPVGFDSPPVRQIYVRMCSVLDNLLHLLIKKSALERNPHCILCRHFLRQGQHFVAILAHIRPGRHPRFHLLGLTCPNLVQLRLLPTIYLY